MTSITFWTMGDTVEDLIFPPGICCGESGRLIVIHHRNDKA